MSDTQNLLVLVGSPRRAGNSATLGAAVQRGAERAGVRVALRFIDDYIAITFREPASKDRLQFAHLPQVLCFGAAPQRVAFDEDHVVLIDL